MEADCGLTRMCCTCEELANKVQCRYIGRCTFAGGREADYWQPRENLKPKQPGEFKVGERVLHRREHWYGHLRKRDDDKGEEAWRISLEGGGTTYRRVGNLEHA